MDEELAELPERAADAWRKTVAVGTAAGLSHGRDVRSEVMAAEAELTFWQRHLGSYGLLSWLLWANFAVFFFGAMATQTSFARQPVLLAALVSIVAIFPALLASTVLTLLLTLLFRGRVRAATAWANGLSALSLVSLILLITWG